MNVLRIVPLFFLMACLSQGPSEVNTYEANGVLKHIVLLDIKENCSHEDVDRVVQALYSLQEISEVIDLEVSLAIDTQDDRLIDGYDVLLYTEFDNEVDLKRYAQDAFHLSVREELKPYLASRPRVIDAVER